MSSWAVVGATRGIGFEYVNQLSADSNNIVFALIRSQNTAGALNELAQLRKNIHVIQTDISNPEILKETAEKIGQVTGGKLDVLINNAFLAGTEAMILPPTAFSGKEAELEREIFEPLKVNLLHVVFTVNAFLPLIRSSQLKKIIYISSGNGDIGVIRTCELSALLGYCVSKASGNIVMAKYAAELKHEGILTLSLSPGWVATDAAKEASDTPEAFEYLLTSFQKMDPSVTGMISTSESVKAQLSVIGDLDASKSGSFVSHRGDNVHWF
ncbi:Fc.00g055000.m01.CDS01 [Cosmosporella sp. VM-42]